jgi:hypothetical protein
MRRFAPRVISNSLHPFAAVTSTRLSVGDLKAATGFIGSLTTFWLVAKSTIRMFGREKTYTF